MNNMTALVSCFARYYHTKTDEAKIFYDPLAGEILSEDEKNAIAENMKNGIAFFDPNSRCARPSRHADERHAADAGANHTERHEPPRRTPLRIEKRVIPSAPTAGGVAGDEKENEKVNQQSGRHSESQHIYK